MCNIKLAIIIPYYKLEYFEDTLKSLSNQTNKNFNVYIGDDNSPESPLELIENYQDQLNIVYNKFDTNLGSKGMLTEQWERCIDLSKNEEWLMVLADDDYVGTNFVESFYNSLSKAKDNNTDLLRFKMRRVDYDNRFLTDLEQPILQKGNTYLWEDEIHKRFISISENVFSRKIYTEKGFRKYPLAWRVPFMMYLDFANERNVLGINDAFVAIRRSKNQLTRRTDMDEYKINAMKLCYFDINSEYQHSFTKQQNLRFLKVNTFYNRDKINFSRTAKQFLKFGGPVEFVKFIVKYIIQKK